MLDTDGADTDPLLIDQDRDGSPMGVDRDDLDPLRTPGAEERCDGVDNDYLHGGLAFGATGAVNILQSDVHDNRSGSDGGGVSLDLSSAVSPVTLTMTDTTVQRNEAVLRGGGFMLRKPDALPVILDGGHVRANLSGFGSAGVFLAQPGVEVRNLTLSDHASGLALSALPTGTWSNITCFNNAEDCIYSLGVGLPRSWTLVDSSLHSAGRYAITLSTIDTLTLRNVDFGVGATANVGDIYFDGGVFDVVGVFSGTCALPGGCR